MRPNAIVVIVAATLASFIAPAFAATAKPLEVIVYPAFGTDSTAVIEGRVIHAEERTQPAPEDTRRRNLRRSLKTLMNKEVAGVEVTVGIDPARWTTVTDEEGYFRVEIRQPEVLVAGWHGVTAQAGQSSGSGSLLMVSPQTTHGLISDFDDTVVVSEVNSTRKLLAHSLLSNPLQREAVPGAATLYAQLLAHSPQASPAPLIYLSASPRQFQAPIQEFLDHNRFPRGVLITKRVTNDATSDPLKDQVAYKTAKLLEIFERLPQVKFTLIGDDGEHDPEIYQDLQQRYPDRVTAIWIRRVHPDADRARLAGQGDLTQLLAIE